MKRSVTRLVPPALVRGCPLVPSRESAGMGRNRTETIGKTRRAVAEVLRRQGYVSAVDVLMQMGELEKAGLEDWRMGRVPFLEKILVGNLS